MKINVNLEKKSLRYHLLDSIRGLVLVSMILYHGCWDLVYIFGKDWIWYRGTGAYIWQQSICWSFILLSGFCWSLGKRHIRRGVIVFTAGAVISFVTIVFMPENRVVFGVLTLIGSCMLFMTVLDKALKRFPARTGLLLSGALFLLTRNVNDGYLGFEGLKLLKLPGFLYRGSFMTFLGFTEPGFYSADYFSFFPWFFLYLAGYFLYYIVESEKDRGIANLFLMRKCAPLSFLGRHSLAVYMIHQPLIYGIFSGIFTISL